MKPPIIVSFASKGRENYNKAQLALIQSAVHGVNWNGHYDIKSLDGWCDSYCGVGISLGAYPSCQKFKCKTHQEVPYQFKLAMIQDAREKGYTQVIWCDSTIQFLKPIDPLLESAKKNGIVVFDNVSYPLAAWIHDEALIRLGIDLSNREYINKLPQIMACCIIFDFSNPVAGEIMDEWIAISEDGVSFRNNVSSRPEYIDHRHDQAILSYLVYKRGIKYHPYGELVYPPHQITKEYGDPYFMNKGV